MEENGQIIPSYARPMTIMGRIRYALFLRKVYNTKIRDLWACYLDKRYYETQFAHEIHFDDTAARKELGEIRKKEPKDQDFARANFLEDQIVNAKAVQKEYNNNERYIKDIKLYFRMLDEAMRPEPKEEINETES